MLYVVNLFGDGVRYWMCNPASPTWEPLHSFKKKHKLRWDQLLFDLSLLNELGFAHWSELATSPEQTGFVLSQNNRIELKKGGRFLEKFRADELYNNRTLFPRFQTDVLQSEHFIEKPLFLFQLETGLIAKYTFEATDFRLDELRFGLTKPLANEEDLLLTEISYAGLILLKVKEDTVVRGLRIIE
jgi:hypothetical protein